MKKNYMSELFEQGTYCSIEAVRNKHFILGKKLGKNIVDKIVGNNSSV